MADFPDEVDWSVIDLTTVDAIEQSFISKHQEPRSSRPESVRGTPVQHGVCNSSIWSCPTCTYHNPVGNPSCLMCGKIRAVNPNDGGAGWSIGYKPQSKENGTFVVKETNMFGVGRVKKPNTLDKAQAAPGGADVGRRDNRIAPEEMLDGRSRAQRAERPFAPLEDRALNVPRHHVGRPTRADELQRQREGKENVAQRIQENTLSSVPRKAQRQESADDEHPMSPNEFSICDEEAAEYWIYPTNYPVRAYQQQIVEKALFRNTLVSLPTGLGKTLIAAVVMFNYYRWFPRGKVCFMAPTKPLVSQQIEACHNITAIPQEDTAELQGSVHPTERARLWKSRRVFYCTPQSLQNDLEKGICDPKQFVCLVIDEAHRATGNYAYCAVIRLILARHRFFRVLALSATPGSKAEVVQNVLNNLLISHIECKDANDPDVRQHMKQRQEIVIRCTLTPEIQRVSNLYAEIMRPAISRLSAFGVLFTKEPSAINTQQLLFLKERLRTNPPNCVNNANIGAIEADLGLLTSLVHGRKLLLSHGVGSLRQYLENMMEQTRRGQGSRGKLQLTQTEQFKMLMEEVKSFGSGRSAHPKLFKLREILVEHFVRKARNRDDMESGHTSSTSSDTKVIVFSQFRDSVQEIIDTLNKSPHPLIKPKEFVGQGTRLKKPKAGHGGTFDDNEFYEQQQKKATVKGQTQKEQQQIIESFKKGEYNVLVATCIAEEGLDIGEVDLIISFDALTSATRMIQRMGRTGRKRHGKVMILVTEGAEEKKLKASASSAKSISGALRCSKFNLYAHSPRMIPDHIQPELVEQRIEISEWHLSQVGGRGKKRSSSKQGPNVSLGGKRSNRLQDWGLDAVEEERALQMLKADPRPPPLSVTAYLGNVLNDAPTCRVGHSASASALRHLVQFIRDEEWLVMYEEKEMEACMQTLTKKREENAPSRQRCLAPVTLDSDSDEDRTDNDGDTFVEDKAGDRGKHPALSAKSHEPQLPTVHQLGSPVSDSVVGMRGRGIESTVESVDPPLVRAAERWTRSNAKILPDHQMEEDRRGLGNETTPLAGLEHRATRKSPNKATKKWKSSEDTTFLPFDTFLSPFLTGGNTPCQPARRCAALLRPPPPNPFFSAEPLPSRNEPRSVERPPEINEKENWPAMQRGTSQVNAKVSSSPKATHDTTASVIAPESEGCQIQQQKTKKPWTASRGSTGEQIERMGQASPILAKAVESVAVKPVESISRLNVETAALMGLSKQATAEQCPRLSVGSDKLQLSPAHSFAVPVAEPAPLPIECDQNARSVNGNPVKPVDDLDSEFCSVCRGREAYEDDEIVFCDRCGIGVHQNCYGIDAVPQGAWFCEACIQRDESPLSPVPRCRVCPRPGGALKATADGDWVHVVCALWVPAIKFDEKLRPLSVRDLPECSHLSLCNVCRTERGCVIDCAVQDCDNCFHPLCGLNNGQKFVEREDLARREVFYEAYCPHHSGGKFHELVRCEDRSCSDHGKREWQCIGTASQEMGDKRGNEGGISDNEDSPDFTPIKVIKGAKRRQVIDDGSPEPQGARSVPSATKKQGLRLKKADQLVDRPQRLKRLQKTGEAKAKDGSEREISDHRPLQLGERRESKKRKRKPDHVDWKKRKAVIGETYGDEEAEVSGSDSGDDEEDDDNNSIDGSFIDHGTEDQETPDFRAMQAVYVESLISSPPVVGVRRGAERRLNMDQMPIVRSLLEGGADVVEGDEVVTSDIDVDESTGAGNGPTHSPSAYYDLKCSRCHVASSAYSRSTLSYYQCQQCVAFLMCQSCYQDRHRLHSKKHTFQLLSPFTPRVNKSRIEGPNEEIAPTRLSKCFTPKPTAGNLHKAAKGQDIPPRSFQAHDGYVERSRTILKAPSSCPTQQNNKKELPSNNSSFTPFNHCSSSTQDEEAKRAMLEEKRMEALRKLASKNPRLLAQLQGKP